MIPQGDLLSALSVMPPHTTAPGVSGNREFFLQHTRNLDTVSPLRAPFLSLLPLSAIIIIHPPPFFLKSKFPFAARSAECCCLLCTQKFAEAVSCPQTSAPWSGVGEERQGLDGCTCCLMWLCQNVLCMDLYVCVHARVSGQLFK